MNLVSGLERHLCHGTGLREVNEKQEKGEGLAARERTKPHEVMRTMPYNRPYYYQ